MALDWRGIGNIGEFYSQHYLDALFENDLKELVGRWNAAEKQGTRSPVKRLAALSDRFFRALAQASGERDAGERLALAQPIHNALLDALGFSAERSCIALDDGRLLPVVLHADVQNKPLLWVLETSFAADADDASALDECVLPSQCEPAQDAAFVQESYRELLDGVIFREQAPPRWVLLLGGAEVLLVDRNKWHQGKYLRFDLNALLARRETAALQAMAGLLHRDVLSPTGGPSLLDQVDENSHKHAYAVSTDLKRGVQRALELLANEAMHYRGSVQKQAVYSGDDLAEQLTRECIVYLYRLLFLFYVEARGKELGVVPMGADAYRLGYSLESLRDLEQVPLTTPAASEGYFLNESLRQLFHIVQHGHPRQRQLALLPSVNAGAGEPLLNTFALRGLRSAMFDEERTPLLKQVKFRNVALQGVIRLLSLSDPERGKQRGRISYALLGINQLGAVYEGLLSYRGFFAREDCLEVHAKGADVGEGESHDQSYFVPLSRKGEFKAEEIRTDPSGRPLLHKKGTFLFRMAGRDREKSASYYTPEVLAECLVRYTLKERIGEDGAANALKADELLSLTLCEPAMGSGAFLNQAIDQLADAYLRRKQAETGQRIESDKFQFERQKVKQHFATQQCYGVDLNPLAAELGKISLWLNVLHEESTAPFLDLRLRVGNSLIGARREVFRAADLQRKATKTEPNWLGMTPEALPLGAARTDDAVYHFLVPDADMAPFDRDKVLAELEPKGVEKLKAWRKAILQPFSPMEVLRLQKLSARIDVLWEQHLEEKRAVLAKMPRTVALWGQPAPERATMPQDALTLAEYAKKLEEPTAAGQRLWRVMDYWCALWFWPLSAADELPTREAWLQDVEALLGLAHERLEVDRDRDARVQELAGRLRFFHWQVAFVEVFAGGGGMDVIVGNPPWRKVEWNEAGVLADFDAALAVKKLSAKQWADRRDALVEMKTTRSVYAQEAEEAAGLAAFLNSFQNYALLRGVQTNLYKCFMNLGMLIGMPDGVIGILHQKGLYDDPRGGQLREALAHRLSYHFHFVNKLMLFSEIKDEKHYELSVFQAAQVSGVHQFWQVSNLFHPSSIAASFASDGSGLVPGIKREDDNWDLRGHSSRLVPIVAETLALFARLYDESGTPALQARLPIVHSVEILNVLRRFADAPCRLADLEGRYFATEHLHETNQQKDGTIRRDTRVARNASEWVVSGPHFHVGTPFNKTPNEGCSHNQDYSTLDLTQLPDDYLPRTNYVPACSAVEYRKRGPTWNGRPIIEFFRYVNRRMIAPTGERTLIPAIVPPQAAHLGSVFSIAFADNAQMVHFSAMNASLPIDFFSKTSGKADARADLLNQFPLAGEGAIRDTLILRALRLNCLTTHYAPLWEELYTPAFTEDAPATSDPRADDYTKLKKRWHRDVAFRTPFARRQALVELDALAALALGLTLDELLLIYRVQFPVLQQYERETFYDARGKIVFTTNRGLSDVGLTRKQWEEIAELPANARLPEWARDAGGPFKLPFDRRDREEDMAEAYREFVKRYGKPKPSTARREVVGANDNGQDTLAATKPGPRSTRPKAPKTKRKAG